MKLIFITREGYDLAGARIRCYNFARELKKYGVDTEVLSFADTLEAKSGREENNLRARDKLRYNAEALIRLKKEKNAIFFLNRFHYHSFAPWLLHLINSNKLIFDLDDWEIREDPKYYFGFWPSSKAEFLIRRLANNSNLCTAASRFLKDFLSKYSKRVYYLPSGVDTDLFKPIEKSKDNSKIIFSWIGTMHREDDIENIKFIVECFIELRKKYKNIFLEIVGDGIYGNKLKAILARYNQRNISFIGWIHPDEVPMYLSKIDVGLVPLIQDTKFNRAKSPAKLFEYMAMGKSVIGTDMGEMRYIIKNGENGFLAAKREEFIEKMQILLQEEDLRKKMGNRAREKVTSDYSLSVLGRKLFKLTKQVGPLL